MQQVTDATGAAERMPYEGLSESGPDVAVSVVLKLRGETCDIDCLYCYEKRKEAPGGARINVEDIRRLAQIFGARPLAIELHGGEPLTMGHEALAAILVELSRQPSVVRVSMQTNGVQLDDAWLDLFDRICPGLEIGISLDGDERGNRWRVGYDGVGTYPRVVRALRLLGERGRKVGVIAAVTPEVLGRAREVVQELATFSAVNAVSFVPCFDTSVRRPTGVASRRPATSRVLQSNSIDPTSGPAWAITPAEYTDFVLDAAEVWVGEGLHSRLKLEPIVSTIRRIRGLNTQFCHFSGLKCDHVFTLYPDARLGSCDELPWPAAELIPLEEATDEAVVVGAQRNSVLLSAGRALMNKCGTCSYRATCGGGCVATRLRFVGVGSDDAYCDHRMRLVDGVAALIAAPSDGNGLRCTTLRWQPREPNSMRDVAGFLARWGDQRIVRAPAVLATSEFGNINTLGAPGVHEADDLDPAHPQWRQAIEPGVWPLVEVFTTGFGVPTYDSCQGHDYRGRGDEPVGRRVGLLPRNAGEYSATAAALCRIVRATHGSLPAGVGVSIGRADLICRTTGKRFPALDVYLEPVGSRRWDAYFAGVGAATTILADAVRANPLRGTTCTCATERASASVTAA